MLAFHVYFSCRRELFTFRPRLEESLSGAASACKPTLGTRKKKEKKDCSIFSMQVNSFISFDFTVFNSFSIVQINRLRGSPKLIIPITVLFEFYSYNGAAVGMLHR